MENSNSDQPAFPLLDPNSSYTREGLTKREYFAGLFTQAIVSSIDSEENYGRLKAIAGINDMKVSQWIACDAVKQADALLLELSKPSEVIKETEKTKENA